MFIVPFREFCFGSKVHSNMLKFYKLILILFLPLALLAQVEQNAVKLKTGLFYPTFNIKNGVEKELKPSLFNHRYYLLITFTQLPGEEAQKQLSSSGIEIGEYLGGYTYFSSIPGNFDFTSLTNVNIDQSFSLWIPKFQEHRD